MTRECIAEPVSWLRLERHHLGESTPAERAALEQHLSVCPACAACLARIEADARPLPALPPRVGRPRRWGAAAGFLALAAAAALVLGRPRPGEERGQGGVKGGEDAVVFTLVSDDGRRIDDPGGAFREGTRFKALVTCPPGTGASFDVAVFDDAGVSFPLEPARAFACGNDVPIAGAFRLTGAGHQTVCVFWSAAGDVDRAALARGPGRSGARSICKELDAAP